MLIGNSSFRNSLCYAFDYQQARVFSSIHGLCFKDVAATSKDIHENTLLHVAASQALASLLNLIYGSTLQMQTGLQWFKEIGRISPPPVREVGYQDNLMVEELFKESLKGLMKQGEKWIKDINPFVLL